MLYDITIRGTRPIIMHNGAAGLAKRSSANLAKDEITRKPDSNRTASDDARLAELETQTALYLDKRGAPTLPEAALRSCIETAARKLKQGPQVREGLTVLEVKSFGYDRKKYGTMLKKLVKTTQFTVPVVIRGRGRLLRTRAKFDEWCCTFAVDADDELVDKDQLEAWLDIAGRRIGLGDWRPEKSGHYGRFEVVDVKAVE